MTSTGGSGPVPSGSHIVEATATPEGRAEASGTDRCGSHWPHAEPARLVSVAALSAAANPMRAFNMIVLLRSRVEVVDYRHPAAVSSNQSLMKALTSVE